MSPRPIRQGNDVLWRILIEARRPVLSGDSRIAKGTEQEESRGLLWAGLGLVEAEVAQEVAREGEDQFCAVGIAAEDDLRGKVAKGTCEVEPTRQCLHYRSWEDGLGGQEVVDGCEAGGG